jgi:hypothetical protein
MQEILYLIEKYIDVQNEFWADDQCPDEIKFDMKTYEWMKNEWALLDKIDSMKKQILGLIENDKELFNKYLTLGSCIKIEDYEQAEIIKNEIINYGKTA